MTTLVSNQKIPAEVFLPKGNRLTVVVAAVGTAIVERYKEDTFVEKVALSAGVTRNFGEYHSSMKFKISCLTGSMTYVQAQSNDQVKVRATQTNDNAAAGEIGEFLSTTVAVGDAVSETTNTPVDVCTLALTPGDWDISGTVNRDLAGVTATRYAAAISPTADTVPAQAGGSGVSADSVVTQNATFGTTVTGNYVTQVGPVRVSLAAAATMHLVGADLFSAGTVGLFGTLRARRVR